MSWRHKELKNVRFKKSLRGAGKTPRILLWMNNYVLVDDDDKGLLNFSLRKLCLMKWIPWFQFISHNQKLIGTDDSIRELGADFDAHGLSGFFAFTCWTQHLFISNTEEVDFDEDSPPSRGLISLMRFDGKIFHPTLRSYIRIINIYQISAENHQWVRLWLQRDEGHLTVLSMDRP